MAARTLASSNPPIWFTMSQERQRRHARELREAGYTVVDGVVDEAWLAEARARIDALAAAEGARAGSEFQREPGTVRLSDLINKGEVFDRTWRDAWLHQLVGAVIPAYKLSSLNARECLPGAGAQDLHSDARERSHRSVSTIWAIDPFTADNGATRVVPGSHRLLLADLPGDRAAPHPGEVIITCPAGCVVVYDVQLLHSGTRNRSGARRRSLHAAFVDRSLPQQLDQRRYIRPETLARLRPEELRLLDVAGGPAPADAGASASSGHPPR